MNTKLLRLSIIGCCFALTGCNLLPMGPKTKDKDEEQNNNNNNNNNTQQGSGEISGEVLANLDGVFTYHLLGGYGGDNGWETRDDNRMSPTSTEYVSRYDLKLAETLASKPLKYLYYKYITINNDLSWEAGAVINGEYHPVNGGHTFRAVRATYDLEQEMYINDCWIPDPYDASGQHAEALTDNIFMPPYQREPDENGLNWANSPAITTDIGEYFVVVAQYTSESTLTQPGWGFGAVKLN